ncbi:hypothetical protein DEV91_1179 [Phyllobacterium brassicacearum]|nr:hypothetical protein DEV91_1179 [Phyllobacterium brassicacearum]
MRLQLGMFLKSVSPAGPLPFQVPVTHHAVANATSIEWYVFAPVVFFFEPKDLPRLAVG